ncbi:hypothetical protein GTR02_13965 [Kineococcus sp. R8]|uniref:hypothetical protein n=1 Tax=Kineococcus siccus TaxID=2696567 RepID=UPI0014135481|nr:hypothetical protein [Kineococcus siccus]NAZ82923.1 hypothetical protein [Kineococcus siccus]
MTHGFVPQRDEAGNENYRVMRINLDHRVPHHALDEAPALHGDMPRRYAKHPGLEGRDIVDFLQQQELVLGAHDRATADVVARDLDSATVLTVLSWVRRSPGAASSA